MTRFLDKKHRQSIRARNRDYAKPGHYFITICVKDQECLLGEVVDEEMELWNFGGIVQNVWDNLPKHYKHIDLDAFVIMPNHIHGIIRIKPEPQQRANVGAGFAEGTTESGKPAPTLRRHPLSEIIRALKSFSSRRINKIRKTPGRPFWQRNYYERVLRRHEINRYRCYIRNNPLNWTSDPEHPDNS
ncbi:transposase [bacterium]|nr:transposase [bacterium]